MQTTINKDQTHLTLDLTPREAQLLARMIRQQAANTTNGCLEFASVLSEAYYNSRNHFRQPPHAFDKQAPRQPSYLN